MGFISSAIRSCAYSTEPRIIKNPTTASLKRGTGGRSSFNGIVCTIFGCSGFVGGFLPIRLGKFGTQASEYKLLTLRFQIVQTNDTYVIYSLKAYSSAQMRSIPHKRIESGW